ncbi:hypothetical protein [Streptomyces sp. NBRC 110028]|uniref:hypothetical protein n=1 Tax=Streptomyces sp. NBRC 110028 TaxID=1621260 RepID=UPI0018FEF77C|nr:hypothetical protein [Streptomyces sp. NBRC 110028]
MPRQQGARGDDPAFAQGLRDQPGQNGEQRAVRPAGLGRGDLSTQNRELVPKDQYLLILGRRRSRHQEQPREDSRADEVDKSNQHED